MAEPVIKSQATLERRLSLTQVTLYGVGTTVGAGIYALIGAVTATAGFQAPLSFVIAAALAGFSGFSFAELSSRYPQSAGEARYVREGFGVAWLALLVGLGVVAAGIVSAATIANAFVGYINELVPIGREFAIPLVVVVLAGIAGWGIGASVTVAAIITVVEVGGLALVLWAGSDALGALPVLGGEIWPGADPVAWSGMVAGAFLAFFAFIGFEDIVNIAEEARDATRTLPRAILLTLIVTTVLYVLLATVAVLAVPLDDLVQSAAPLALIFERGTGWSPALIGAIGVVAVVNGALIQIIMGSRVLYGLANQGQLPRILARVDPRTRTPLIATALVTAAVLVLALFFRLKGLAQVTSGITLAVFAVVNLALILVKRRQPAPADGYSVPIWVPVLGFLSSFGFLSREIWRLIAT